MLMGVSKAWNFVQGQPLPLAGTGWNGRQLQPCWNMMGSTGLVAQKNRQEPKPVIYHGDKRTSHRLKTIQWPSFLVCDFTNPIVPELDHHFLVGRSPKRRGLSHDMPLSPTISTCTFKNNVRNISWRYDNIFEYICYVLYTVYIIIYIYYNHIYIYTHNYIYT